MLCYRCGTHNPDGSEICIHCGTRFLARSKPSSVVKAAGARRRSFDIGQILAERYELKRFIGSGPVGEVYFAHDRAVNVDLAVKVIFPELFPEEGDREKLVWGIRGIKDISHPNLIRVFDAESSNDGHVLVTMRYVQGVSLKRSIDSRAPIGEGFALREIEPLFLQLRDALIELHPSMVHGNLKPSNIIIQPDFLKITDLGLAEFLPPDTFSRAQRGSGDAVYLAPEILSGSAPAPSSDIFTVGRLLSMMLVGQAPDDASSVKFYAGDEDLDELIRSTYARATHPDPVSRYRSVQEMFDVLDQVFDLYRELPDDARTVSKIISAALAEELADDLIVGPLEDVPPVPPASPPEPPPSPAGEGAPKKKGGPALAIVVVIALAAIIGAGAFAYLKHFAPAGGTRDEGVVAADVGQTVVVAMIDAGALAAQAPDAAEAETPEPDAGAEPPEKSDTPEKPVKADTPDKPEKGQKPDKPDKPGKPDAGAVADAGAKPDKADAADKSDDKPQKSGPPCPKGMIQIKAGKVMMGSQPGDKMRNPDEQAWEPVTTGSFCIDQYEFPNRKGALPRTTVGLSDAEADCRGAGKRLCQETEWERACKGPQMFKYPYGNEWGSDSCNTESALGEPRKVGVAGAFKQCRSGYGVADMSGNVAEWVTSKSGTVVKGGAANKPDWAVRCATRTPTPPGKKTPFTGFRCCVEASGEE